MFNRLELLEEERNTKKKKKRNQKVRVRQKKDNIGNLDILWKKFIFLNFIGMHTLRDKNLEITKKD